MAEGGSAEDSLLQEEDPMDISWPCVKDAYEHISDIGEGGSSTVAKFNCNPREWPDKKERESIVVAIKSIDLEKSPAQLEEIQNEMQTLRQLRHRHIIGYFTSFVVTEVSETGRHKEMLWMVMNLCKYGSALDILRYRLSGPKNLGPFEEPTIATILQKTLLGLAYLHKQGMMHRDVKAANILIAEGGLVQLADFGISTWARKDQWSRQDVVGSLQYAHMREKQQTKWKRIGGGGGKRGPAADASQSRNTFIGTPCWMAPEVMSSAWNDNPIKDNEGKLKSGYDERADVWSLGITAIELATGSAPYASLEPLEAMVATLKKEPPKLENKSSQKFRQFIAHCLKKDPETRMSASQLLESDFIKKMAKDEAYLDLKVCQHLPSLEKMKPKETSVRPKRIESGRFTVSSEGWDFPSSKDGEKADTSVDVPATIPEQIPEVPSPSVELADSQPSENCMFCLQLHNTQYAQDQFQMIKIVDITFDITIGQDTPESVAKEMHMNNLIGEFDLKEVAVALRKLINNPEIGFITFKLYDSNPDAPETENPDDHFVDGKLREGFGSLKVICDVPEVPVDEALLPQEEGLAPPPPAPPVATAAGTEPVQGSSNPTTPVAQATAVPVVPPTVESSAVPPDQKTLTPAEASASQTVLENEIETITQGNKKLSSV